MLRLEGCVSSCCRDCYDLFGNLGWCLDLSVFEGYALRLEVFEVKLRCVKQRLDYDTVRAWTSCHKPFGRETERLGILLGRESGSLDGPGIDEARRGVR